MTQNLLPLRELPPRSDPVLAVSPTQFLAQLLTEQATLSAAEQFSQWHTEHEAAPHQERYRALLPMTMPAAGQQLAFEVNLDRCSGCKACVVACHSLNGLDETESFRDVGVLVSIDEANPAFQHVTTACHHCLDPGCLNGCPVNAYEKDRVTGIVRHLDDQCIGCQYCTLACPYEVPKYHHKKGIVRKCDMCSQRLSVGEAPACVQACPHEAISIRVVDVETARERAATGSFLSATPDPGITIPTTCYIGSATNNTSLQAGTYAVPPLEHAHWPLTILLVFSQISVGVTALVLLSGGCEFIASSMFGLLACAALVAAMSAMSSTLHLGRPQFAYRAVLGVGHSWLSREILAFGGYIPLCGLCALLALLQSNWLTPALWAAAGMGAAGVGASAMIYHVTRRPYWRIARTGPMFLATTVGVSPLIVLAAAAAASGFELLLLRLLACLALGSALFKLNLLWQDSRPTADHSRIKDRQLATIVRWSAAGAIGLAACAGWLLAIPGSDFTTAIASAGIVCGLVMELTERYLFFRAVVPLRMPGVAKT